jgi:hypothetical protein
LASACSAVAIFGSASLIAILDFQSAPSHYLHLG